MEGQQLDMLYRNLDRIRHTIEECRAGRTACHYQPGHPHGFHDHIQVGEVHHCKVLHDASGKLAGLKRLVADYPAPLKRAVIEKFPWEADFALETCRKPAARGDVFYASGCLFRCAASLTQVLFALNERYFVNEKGAVETIETFDLRPNGFKDAVSSVLAQPGDATAQLRGSLRRFEDLVRDVREIARDHSLKSSI